MMVRAARKRATGISAPTVTGTGRTETAKIKETVRNRETVRTGRKARSDRAGLKAVSIRENRKAETRKETDKTEIAGTVHSAIVTAASRMAAQREIRTARTNK